jgi:DNA polymerase zeta
VCDSLTESQQPLCKACRRDAQGAAVILAARASRLAASHALLVRVCLHCGGGGGRVPAQGGVVCDSLDCGVFFERRKAAAVAAAAGALCDAALDLF